MKTNTISPKKTFLYSFIGFLSILLYSCGSYQNSSYYDTDGIYGNTDTRTIARTTERVVETNPNTPYKEYFNSLQNNNQPTEIFTDVDSYGNYDTINDSIQVTNSGYSGWGSNPQDVNVTVYNTGWNNWYGSNWYGPNWGFGFGFNNWYGAWGYPYYGWGYPSYGYTNNYYTYNPGRRGSSYSNRANSNRNYSSRNYSQNQINTVSRNTNNTNFRRNSSTTLNGTAPIFTRGTQSQTRNNSTNPVRTRVNTSTNTTRSESYTPSRYNNSNNSYSPSRSSGNSGGGRPSGGGGGRSRG